MMRWLIICLLITIPSYISIAQDHPHTSIKGASGNYHCPMHPDIVSDKPGKCPKCGMLLVADQPNKGPVVSGDIDTTTSNSISDTVYFSGKTVRYDLYVTDTMVHYTGKMRHAIAINGQLPAPTLYFTEGDTAEIYLHNHLKKEETSLHWHGVILPNQFDGVPYLTTKRLGPGETYLYKFKVVQNGTYWYHSHSGLQEQIGMYGVLVFKKREADHVSSKYAADIPLILSEWTDEHPHQVMRRLHAATDWYAIQKKSTQSYSEALKAGKFGVKFTNEWKRMHAMDVSDVYYNKFLINGSPDTVISASPQTNTTLKAGDTIRLRIANGGASSYFWLTYGGGKITVIASDGNRVKPVAVDRLIVGVSETYDVEVVIPDHKSYEFRATAEDRSGFASVWLGTGERISAPTLPRLNYFEGMHMMNDMMKMNGNMKDMGMKMSLQTMDMNQVMYPELHSPAEDEVSPNNPLHSSYRPLTLNYDMLQSPIPTNFPTDLPVKTLHFSLEGNMNRYLWTLDNKTITEADKILIRRGEIIRLILTNNSMMRHPMHLHGHDFRIVNSKGDYAPLKNVLDIMPMETDTLELAANQDGDWFFHCHILYHMMAGMGRILSYENSAPNPDLPDPEKAWKLFKKDNRMASIMGEAAIVSNGSEGHIMWMSDRYSVQSMWHAGWTRTHGMEVEINAGRYLGKMQWWYPYLGFDYHFNNIHHGHHGTGSTTWFGQDNTKADRKTVVAGLQYTLPWLIVADARIDMEGRFRLQFTREDIPLTPRIRLNVSANSDNEYTVGMRYILTKWLAPAVHYDNDMGWGIGFSLTY